MWKLILAFLLTISVLTPSKVSASLRETQAQIEKRYGPTIKTSTDPGIGKLVTYRYKDYFVLVSFKDGKSEAEFYIQQFYKKQLTHNQVSMFVSMNPPTSSPGGRWMTTPGSPYIFVASDGSAMVTFYSQVPTTDRPGLVICTFDFAKRHKLGIE